MGNSSSKKARKKTKQNKTMIAGGLAVLAAILIIIALGVNELILYSVTVSTFLGDTTTSTRIGHDEAKVCAKLGDNDPICIGSDYGNSCELCNDLNIDYSDCDSCQYLNGARTWLAMNIIALLCTIVVGIIILAANILPKLNNFAKFSKIFMFGAAVCLVIGLIVYYSVADDVGVWNSDADNLYLGASGWLDICAAICAIAGGVLG